MAFYIVLKVIGQKQWLFQHDFLEKLLPLDSGVLSKRSRDEIVQSLSTHILVHTNRPLPDDFHTVCRRLVEKYPSLKDTVDNGYVRTKVLIYVADM